MLFLYVVVHYLVNDLSFLLSFILGMDMCNKEFWDKENKKRSKECKTFNYKNSGKYVVCKEAKTTMYFKWQLNKALIR